MAVNGSSTQNNATIVQQSLSVGAANQLWNIKSSKYGGYSIINQNSGLCLTISSTTSGSGLIQATCNINDTKQIWYLY
jgi:hypothetical protein